MRHCQSHCQPQRPTDPYRQHHPQPQARHHGCQSQCSSYPYPHLYLRSEYRILAKLHHHDRTYPGDQPPDIAYSYAHPLPDQ
jgi:hypothetical protein